MQLSNQYSGVNLFALEPTLHDEEEDDEDDEDDDYLTDGWYSFKRRDYLSVKELQNHSQILLWHWLWALLSYRCKYFIVIQYSALLCCNQNSSACLLMRDNMLAL